MRRLTLVLLVLVWAAPARAAETWLSFAPDPVLGETAIGSDGTQVRAGAVADDVFARVGSGPKVLVGHSPVSAVRVAAAADGRVAVGWGNSEETSIAFASGDGGFSPPEKLPGELDRIALNAHGDAAVQFSHGGTTSTAFRPAGGVFGAPVDVGSAYELLLTGAGDTLVYEGPLGIRSRSGNGPLSPANPDFADARQIALADDGSGRVLVAASMPGPRGDFSVLRTATRSADGVWSPAVDTDAVEPVVFVSVAADAGGDAVVAVRGPGDFDAGGGGTVRGFNGTTTGPELSGPVTVDPATGFGLDTVMRADASAAIVYGSLDEVRVVRRTGSGPFGAPEIAGCGHTGASADALLDNGQLVLDRGAVWNEPGTSAPAIDCAHPSRPGPDVRYSVRRVYAGEPVLIDGAWPSHPDWPVDAVSVNWLDGSNSLSPQPGDRPEQLRHVFAKPGLVPFHLQVVEHRPTGCCSVTRDNVVKVPVYQRATLRVPRQSRRSVRRHGLAITATAVTYGPKRAVTVRILRRGRVVGKRTFNALLDPRTVHIRLPRHVRGSLRAVLRQGSRAVASPVAVPLS